MATPGLFISHGSPNEAVERDGFTQELSAYFRSIPRPRAIVVMSAHWLTDSSVEVSYAAKPEIMYDFGGFSEELYLLKYPAAGSPEWAARVSERLAANDIPSEPNHERGLDHGAWIPLRFGYPDASVPILQISLPMTWSPEQIFRIGEALRPLRKEEVLMIGSGGVVHNLRSLVWGQKNAQPETWAGDFQNWVRREIGKGNARDLIDFLKKAPDPRKAHPTLDHWLPIFFTLGLRENEDAYGEIFNGIFYGTLSMLSFQLAPPQKSSKRGKV